MDFSLKLFGLTESIPSFWKSEIQLWQGEL